MFLFRLWLSSLFSPCVHPTVRNFDRSSVRSRSFRRLNRAFSVLRRTKSGTAVVHDNTEERDNFRNASVPQEGECVRVHVCSRLGPPGSRALSTATAYVPLIMQMRLTEGWSEGTVTRRVKRQDACRQERKEKEQRKRNKRLRYKGRGQVCVCGSSSDWLNSGNGLDRWRWLMNWWRWTMCLCVCLCACVLGEGYVFVVISWLASNFPTKIGISVSFDHLSCPHEENCLH